ncbi:hypothetical protein K438DRAFT_1937920 [Mycena galopus ATCC 62051]|nr:hypothetical protein K438DRAFT_1937920 [Mycena galopus ATCC 62051]
MQIASAGVDMLRIALAWACMGKAKMKTTRTAAHTPSGLQQEQKTGAIEREDGPPVKTRNEYASVHDGGRGRGSLACGLKDKVTARRIKRQIVVQRSRRLGGEMKGKTVRSVGMSLHSHGRAPSKPTLSRLRMDPAHCLRGREPIPIANKARSCSSHAQSLHKLQIAAGMCVKRTQKGRIDGCGTKGSDSESAPHDKVDSRRLGVETADSEEG